MEKLTLKKWTKKPFNKRLISIINKLIQLKNIDVYLITVKFTCIDKEFILTFKKINKIDSKELLILIF